MNYYERIQKILPKTIMSLCFSDDGRDVLLAYLLSNVEQKRLIVHWYNTDDNTAPYLGLKFLQYCTVLDDAIDHMPFQVDIRHYFNQE